MSNLFHGRAGRRLDLNNSATAVFVDVLFLAVSTLAREPWHFRFASLLTLQDQSVMGRGVVGFDLDDLDWGATPAERAAAKEFVLDVVDLALDRHRWDELSYEPARAEGYLREFRAMVREFDPQEADPAAAVPGPGNRMPAVHEAACASCVRHRVLDGLPWWGGCVFCTAGG
ncbi:hypothetical protein [Streptomyces sp. A1136]|uniref:hypothetical protein n=2 Tax=unclassified Streptomyces TaxID=2593676 RepID=UPI001F0DC474|nr:hypothetical protein [Streptomyces sp. A1136]